MKLSVNELRKNHIVHVIRDGEGHYSVVRKVTDTSVYLADPSLGNIEMTKEEFSAIYSGIVLRITNPKLAVLPVDSSIQTNEASEQNNTNAVSVQPENNKALTTEVTDVDSSIQTNETLEQVNSTVENQTLAS